MRCEWLYVPIHKHLLKYTMKLQQDFKRDFKIPNEILRFQVRFQDSSEIPRFQWDSKILRFQWDSKGVVRDSSWWRTPRIHYIVSGLHKAVADGPVGQVLAGPVSECNKHIFYNMLTWAIKTTCDVSIWLTVRAVMIYQAIVSYSMYV